MKKLLLVLAIPLLIGAGCETQQNNNNIPKVEFSDEKVSCTRDSRQQNEPQFDRALSLINQRISEWNTYISPENQNDSHLYFEHFSPGITNCIKVISEDIEASSGIEGYFIFNDEKIGKNYFPIAVNKNYNYTDDLTTALLLSHELTHVQQYIDSKNNNTEISCIDSEVYAFIAQLDFYALLNNEEIESIWSRINLGNKTENIQFEMLDAMMLINRQSDCGFGIGKDTCRDNYLRNSLKDILSNNDYYKEQCNI